MVAVGVVLVVLGFVAAVVVCVVGVVAVLGVGCYGLVTGCKWRALL